MRLDALDAGILRLLAEDARLSFREIAARLGTTTPTVSQRVKDLEALGVLRGYRAEIGPEALGGQLHVVTVRARPAAAERVAGALAALAGAEEVLVLSGGAVQARVRVRAPASLSGLHDALAGLDEVASYEVAEVIAAPHRRTAAPPQGELDVPCHQCGGPIRGEPERIRLSDRPHVFCCRQCLADFKARHEKAAKKA